MGKQTLGDQLGSGLRELSSAERQTLKVLLPMSRGALTRELKDTFRARAAENKDSIARLTTMLKILKSKAPSTVCIAMRGILEECAAVLNTFEKGTLRDAALIGAAQHAEQYKATAYDTMREFAKLLGEHDVTELLEASWSGSDLAHKKLKQIGIQVYAEAYVDTHSPECPPHRAR